MSHSYLSDVSREQFARIIPTLESARCRTKPRTVDLYDVFCGVRQFPRLSTRYQKKAEGYLAMLPIG